MRIPTANATTVGEWFRSLEPQPPRALSEALHGLLAEHESRPARDVPEVCLMRAEEMLAQLMRSGSSERATALTLLAVDSLVTYAFEAAASDGAQIEERAANAMKRIAELAERTA